MTEVTLPLAVLAGVVSFASPCCLPLVPVFVTYLVGTTASDTAGARRTALSQALTFVMGFSAVFVALWASLALVGYALGDYRGLLRVAGGAVLIVMGLHVAGLVQIALLNREVRVPVGASLGGPPPVDADTEGLAAPSYRRSLLLGVAFAAGWTPCIGPILGGILGLASVSGGFLQGAGLLLAYAMGLGAPFVVVALGATEISRRLGWVRRHQTAVSAVSGALLVLIGFSMITDLLGRLSVLVPAFGL